MKHRLWNSIFFIFVLLIMSLHKDFSIHAQTELDNISSVYGLALHPNGQILAIGGRYNDQPGIWFYDLSTDTITGIPTEKNVTSLFWRPDGNAIAAGVETSIAKIQIYETVSNTLMYDFERQASRGQVIWSDDSSTLMVSAGSQVLLRDGSTGNIVQTFLLPQNTEPSVWTIEWDQSNNILYGVLDTTPSIIRWDTTTGDLLSPLSIPFVALNAELSHDNTKLAVGSLDGSGHTLILDASTGDQLLEIGGTQGKFVLSLEWSPNSTDLATYSTNSNPDIIQIWNSVTGQLVNTITKQGVVAPDSMLWSSDAKTVIFSAGQYSPRIITPPSADAGLDQIYIDSDNNGIEDITLNGSGSTDTDGTIVSYSWTENGIEIATSVSPQVDLAVGTHTITLTVTDDDGATGIDNVVITVEAQPSASCNTTIPASDTAALISAITSANGAGTPQTLCLTSSTYTLTAVDNTTDGANGLPSITGDITIIGNAATIIFETGSGFEVAGEGRLTLLHLTVISDNGG